MTDREANDKLYDDESGVPGLHRAIDNMKEHAAYDPDEAARVSEKALRESKNVVDLLFISRTPEDRSPELIFVEAHAAGTDIGVKVGEWLDAGDGSGIMRLKLANGTSNEQVDRLAQYILDEFPNEIGRDGSEEGGAVGVAIRVMDMAKEIWTLASYLTVEQVGEEVDEREAIQKAIGIMSKHTEYQRLDGADRKLLDSAQQLCQYIIAAFPEEARKSGGNTIGPKVMAGILERQENIIDSLVKEIGVLRRKSWWRRTWDRMVRRPSTIAPLGHPKPQYPFQCDDCTVIITDEEHHTAHHAMTGH